MSKKQKNVELAPLHVQSAWRSRGERVRAARLAACCNYFSKKKIKEKKIEEPLWHNKIKFTGFNIFTFKKQKN